MNKIKLAVLVGTILAPIALILLLRKSNNKKEERWKQWAQPLIALTFTILCILLFSKLSQLLDWFLNLPYMASVREWIRNGSGLTYGVILYGAYIINLAILIGYLVFKQTYRKFFALTRTVIRFFVRLVRGKGKKNEQDENSRNSTRNSDIPQDLDQISGPRRLYWHLLNLFYRIDDGSGLVRSGWLAVCKTILYAGRILGVLYLLLILFAQLPLLAGFSWYPYALAQRLMESCYLWPAISAVTILEFAHYLDGSETFVTEKEEEESPAPQEKRKPEIDYTPLAEKLRATYAERYAASMQSVAFPRVQEIPAPDSELTKAIYKRLSAWEKKNNRTIGKSTLDCIASLPDRKNAVIDAQMSEDFGECLMLYINILLARGENLLVLCRNEEVCDRIKDYIRTSLESINGLTPVWIVRSVEDVFQNGDCDVLVLPPEKIMNDTVINAQSRFFDGLTTVLMIDTARLISTMGFLLTAVANRLEVFGKEPIQYIALCNGMPDELRATLEQSISPGNEFRAFECFSSNQNTRIMIWNYEPTGEDQVLPAQHNLFRAAMDQVYLGVALPIACTAFKYHVGQISIMGNNIPVRQLIDTIRLNYSHMSFYFNKSQTIENLLDSICFNEIESENPFIVAIDDTYNLPMAIHNYSRYIGSSSAMVHLISKPYMLRDYFADNVSEYIQNKSKMEMLSSVIRDSPKAMVMRMFFEASSEEGLSEDLLISQLRKVGMEVTSLMAALETCYRTIYNKDCDKLENYFIVKTEPTFDRQKNDFLSQRVVYLKDQKLLEQLIREIQPACVNIEGRIISLSIPCGNILRYYLPDQVIIADGKMYYIDRIDRENGMLYTGRMIENLNLPVDYIQHRKYTLSDIPGDSERKTVRELSIGQADEMQAESYEVELLRHVPIQVDTYGYMAPHPSFPFPDLTNRTQYMRLDDSIQKSIVRHIPNGSVLALRFKGIEEGQCDKLAITLSVMISEMMKTLFPYNWQCIAVCPVLRKIPEETDDGISFENLSLIYPQVVLETNTSVQSTTAEILIIDDSDIDSGVLDALFHNHIYPLDNVFAILRDYLSWHKKFEAKDNANNSPDYLKFGAEEIPEYFDLDLVEELLKQMTIVYPSGIDWQDPTARSNYCYFCHKDLRLLDPSEYQMLKDEFGKNDRKVCNECYPRLIKDKKDVIPLFEQVQKELCADYGITLPSGIKLKFESAAKIRKNMTRKKRRFRVIGLASGNKTVWVERLSPPERILETLAHELTHSWQFENLRMEDMTPEATEGHSSYVEVDYLRRHGYTKEAHDAEESLRRRDDEYGRGFVQLDEALKGCVDKNPFTYMKEIHGK